MTDLRRCDEQARERALDVARSFIVQAPAGSGKTELLIRRFLALLATVTAPESVLAITFTRKAAAEMRDRILRALRAATDPTSAGGRPSHARTLELARKVLELDTRLGWDLLGNPARLRIQTIDALNFGLARRLPVLSGLGADLAVEDDARELYRKAAERLLEHLPGGDDLHSRAVATLLAHVDNRVPRFVDLVIEMLARRDAWGPVLPEVSADEVANADLLTSLERARTELVEAHLAALAREFPDDLLADAAAVAREAAATLVAAGSESPITAWAGYRDTPRGTLADGEYWLGLAALLLTADGTPRRSLRLQGRLSARKTRRAAQAARAGSGVRAGVTRATDSAARGSAPAAGASLHEPTNGVCCRHNWSCCDWRRPNSKSCFPTDDLPTTRASRRPRCSHWAVTTSPPIRHSRWTRRSGTCWSTNSRTRRRHRSACSGNSPAAGNETTAARCSWSATQCSPSTGSGMRRSACSSTCASAASVIWFWNRWRWP